jgi:hypothetical protein
MEDRPLAVTIVGWTYVAAGVIGFAYHFDELLPPRFSYDALLIEAVRLIAIVAGVFLLRGRNWARWLAVAWLLFHVVVSVWHTPAELAMHVLFLALIAWGLFRRASGRYFRGAVAR